MTNYLRILGTSNPPVGYSNSKVNNNYDALTKSRGTREIDDMDDLW
ncbi:MAG: hypothetical protein IJT97_11550 [Bacteroidaceae bacterium]|nr:hypothetical protein [Bacteroidaceae bacterium]